MLKRIISGAIAGTLSAALLAGCGGGGGSQAVPSTPGSAQTTGMTVKIIVPGSSTTNAKTGKRIPLYTSRSTKGIGFEFFANPHVYAGGPSASPLFGTAIAAGSNGCATAGSDGSFTCTVYIGGVPVGYNDFRIGLWDAAPTGCNALGGSCSFAAAHLLSGTVTNNIVTLAGIVNNLSFTFRPVVDSIYVQVPSGIVDGAPIASSIGYVVAKDAQGNIILGTDPYVDSSYNGFNINVDIANDLGAGGCSHNSTGTPCSLSFTAAANPSFGSAGASGNSFTYAYDGLQQFPTSGASQPQFTASVSAGGVTNIQNTNLQVTSSSNGITVPGQPQITSLLTYNQAPLALTVGADKAIWMTNTTGLISRAVPTKLAGASLVGANAFNVASSSGFVAGQVLYVGKGAAQESFTITSVPDATHVSIAPATAANSHALNDPATASITFGAGQGVAGNPAAIVAGSEGYLWYTDSASGAIARFAPVATGSIAPTETPAIAGATFAGMVLGPDGNVWFGDSAHSQLDTVDPNNFSAAWSLGSNQFSLGAAPAAVASGPLFNSLAEKSVCAIEPSAPGVQCLDLTTKTLTGVTTSAVPVSLAIGADNKMYVGEVGKIEAFTVSGSTFAAGSSPYALANAGASVRSITVSQDGNLWFVETGAASPTFGNLNIQSATPTLNEFSASTNIPAGTTPFQLILDQNNGTMYFTDNSANKALDQITP